MSSSGNADDKNMLTSCPQCGRFVDSGTEKCPDCGSPIRPEPEETLPIAPLGDGTHCPSCGKFVGAYERCPYCQAEMKVRLSLKMVRRIAMGGALIGLVLLWFGAMMKQVDQIHVGDINVNHNMATVKLEGRLVSVNIQEANNTFKLALDDGTGRINLSGFDKLERFRKALGDGFPREGDKIEVTGQLNITEKFGAGMFLSSPERLKVLERFEPEQRMLDLVTDEDTGRILIVEAQIIDIRKTRASRNLTLRDDSGTMSLTVFDSEFDGLADGAVKSALDKPGSIMKMLVKVDSFRGNLQLRLKNPRTEGNLEVIGFQTVSPAAMRREKITPLADLAWKNSGDFITIEAVITKIREFKAGRNIMLKDDTDTALLVVFNSFLDSMSKEKSDLLLTVGQKIRARVKVSQYRDTMQVQLFSEKYLEFLEE